MNLHDRLEVRKVVNHIQRIFQINSKFHRSGQILLKPEEIEFLEQISERISSSVV